VVSQQTWLNSGYVLQTKWNATQKFHRFTSAIHFIKTIRFFTVLAFHCVQQFISINQPVLPLAWSLQRKSCTTFIKTTSTCLVLSLFAFSALTSKLLNFSPVSFACNLGLRMRNFTWSQFPITNLLIDSLRNPIVGST